MKKNLLLIIALCWIQLVEAQEMTRFDSLVVRAEMTFTKPKGLIEIKKEWFRKMPHQLILAPEDTSFQMRFYIDPLDTWMADYEKKSRKEKKNSLHPNKLCASMMVVALLNASNQQNMQYGVMPVEMTKQIYNADWEAHGEFVNGWKDHVNYEFGYLMCIHKDNIADIYITMLSNKKDWNGMLSRVANSIRFK